MPSESRENLERSFIPDGNQKRIIEYLSRIKSDEHELSIIYQGAIQAFNNRLLTDKFSLAAHGFRELIEKLSLALSSIKVDPNELPNRVRTLSEEHQKITSPDDPEHCLECNKWVHGRKSLSFLEKVSEFLRWFSSKPNPRDRYRDVLRSLDPLKISLPEATLDAFSLRFKELYGYFTNVSHHKKMNLAIFDEKVASLETIMLNLFYPPTFPKHDEIDRIINEAEGNDH